MSLLEPLPSRATVPRTAGNPYTGRWRWWYSAIADEMLKNPKVTQAEIAKTIGRSPTTVSFIMATDIFREYFAQRRAEYSRQHDDTIRKKLLGVTEAALDTLQGQINKKGDQIPIGMVKDITEMALEKLGYGVTPTPAQVVVQNNLQSLTISPASLSELEAARSALRAAEARRVDLTPTLAGPGEAGDTDDVVEALMEDRQGASSE